MTVGLLIALLIIKSDWIIPFCHQNFLDLIVYLSVDGLQRDRTFLPSYLLINATTHCCNVFGIIGSATKVLLKGTPFKPGS